MSEALYSIANVAHRYGTRTVLHIPALDARPGELLALVGPSGAGKSTLLRLLALLEAPAQGTVQLRLNGRSIAHDTATLDDRRQIGMVFQQPLLLSRSVRDNVAYGLRLRGEKDPGAQVETILKRLQMLDMMKMWAHTLSGGEAQRVALARTFVLHPDILLLDEPTANLDPTNVEIIENLIREYHEHHGATIVLVTHNIFQAKRLATRVGFLLGGDLVEIAPTEKLFAAPDDPRTAAFLSGTLVY